MRFTDTDGEYGEYEFLDIVLYNNCEYVIVSPLDADGYVDIFRIMGVNDKEVYVRVQDDETLEKVFEIFRVKNEDEFDFE